MWGILNNYRFLRYSSWSKLSLAESRSEDSLRHSRRRINAYRALASPSLISLSSKDPILTAFKLSWELRELAFAECEFKSEYMVWFNWKFRRKLLIWLSAFQSLKQQCQDYATALLDHTRSSTELEVILNYDPNGPAYQVSVHYIVEE